MGQRVARPARRFALALAIALVAAACGGDDSLPPPSADEAIRVGAFNFAESELLAELYAQALENQGLPVARLGAIGPREVVEPALELGLIDVVPEYAGTMLEFVNLGAGEATADPVRTVAILRSTLEPRGMVALLAAPAQDRNVLVVRRQFATEHGVRAVSDLAPLTPDLAFGGPAECPERFFCLVGLREVYGLEFGSFAPLPAGAVVADALRGGEIDVALLFSTDAELLDPTLTPLVDDGGLQPAENVVPIVRRDALDRWGARVAVALNAVSRQLDTVTLRTLNSLVLEGAGIPEVTRNWLVERGLLD